MAKRVLLAGVAFIVLGAVSSFATDVTLGLSVNTTTSTWTVTATTSDNATLGIANYGLDVLGSNGISIIKAATAAQTNQSPNPPFNGLGRTTGTVSGTNLVGINASQDQIDAAANNDDSGLGYGYGNLGTANGQFTSGTWPGGGTASPGQVPGLGTMTIAQGRFTGTLPSSGLIITAEVTPGGFFSLFPSNWDPDSSPTNGNGTIALVAAGTVNPATFSVVPEPTTLVLLGLGGLGLAFAARRRS